MDGVVCKIMVEFCDHLSYTKKLLTMLKTIKVPDIQAIPCLGLGLIEHPDSFRQEGDELHRPSCLLPERTAYHEHKSSSWWPAPGTGAPLSSVDMLSSHHGPHGPWSMIHDPEKRQMLRFHQLTVSLRQYPAHKPSVQNVMNCCFSVKDGASPNYTPLSVLRVKMSNVIHLF